MIKRMFGILIALQIVLSGFLGITAFGENNLIFSENFEGDISKQWTFASDYAKEHIKVLSGISSEGSKSLYLEDDSDSVSGVLKSSFFDMIAGKTYIFSADFKHVEGTQNKVYFKFADENGKFLSASSSFGSKETEWTNASVKVLAPEGTVKGQLWLAGNSAALGKTYIDNIKIYEVTNEAEMIKPAKTKTNVFDIVLPFSESFETDNAYFSPWGADKNPEGQEISEDYASDGKKSVKVVDNGKDISSGIQFVNFPVTEGEAYLATADMYRVSGKFNMYLRFYSSAGKQLYNSQTVATAEKSWEQIKLAAIAPEGAVKGSVLFVTTGAAIDILGYIDNVKIEESEKYKKELGFNAPKQSAPIDAELVSSVDGKLVYKEYNDKGDKIGDYSYAGFYSGDYILPESSELPVAKVISPTGTDDDTEMLQNAINEVFNESNDHSMKILKLKAGKYYINKNGINLKSGVVLQGEGQGPTGTVLYAKDPVSHTVVKISGMSPENASEPAIITDSYLKSGEKTFSIPKEQINDYSVGDSIVIYHPSTDTWNEAMKMKGITSYTGADTSWDADETDVLTERTITNIEGNKITVDFPVFIPYNRELSESYIYKINDTRRIENSGIENLRIVSYYASETDEEHASVLVYIEYAENIFIRDVTGKHFINSFVQFGKRAKQVTVLNCSALEPISKITGSRRYSYAANRTSQQILVTGCYSNNGRHDFETSYQCTGPIVFSDNHVHNSSNGSETHGGWSTGVLYDNVYQTGHLTKSYMALANRGGFGGSYSHGWATAGSIMWNCLSNAIIVHKPEADYQNFAVGIWGLYDADLSLELKKSTVSTHRDYYRTTKYINALDSHFETSDSTSIVGDSYKEAIYTSVNPRSLFKAQLSERYTGSISNARPNSPILIDPLPDLETEKNTVEIKGVYQLGAEGVKIYIDDVCYEAQLNSEDNTFTLEKELSDGVHKIYATQTIDGVEGIKCADRFITIGNGTYSNEAYLNSIYKKEKTILIVNDIRESFDVYNKTIMDTTQKIKVIVNGSKIEPDVDPYETQGRVLVPMRAIFEALYAEVSWDEVKRTATAVSFTGATTVKITENNATAYINDTPVTLDVPATILNGRFVVPVRFISEALGCNVGWIDEKKTVTVDRIDNSVPVTNVEWSHASNEQRIGEFAVDRDLTTRWAGDGKGVWLKGEFTETANISAFKTVFADQDLRSYNFDIYLSENGVDYVKVYSGTTSSDSEGDLVTIPAFKNAKYFKFVGQGGSSTDWILLYELEFYNE